MAELNLQGSAGADDSQGPLSSREGRTRRNASDTDSLLGRDGVREVKATVKELAGVLKELARVQKQELKNEQTRLNQEKRQQDRQQRQQQTLQERQQRQDQRRLERDQRRFDRDYDAAYQQEDRRNYTSLRYNADFDNRLVDRDRAEAAAAAEKPTFGTAHRGWLGSAGYNTARNLGMGEGAAKAFGSGAARMAGYVGDSIGATGILEGLAGLDALALPGGPVTEIPALAVTGTLAATLSAYKTQQAVSHMLSGLLGNAQPYIDLTTMAANAGRAGNFDGGDLVSALFGDSSKRDYGLNKYGIGYQQVGDIMRAYGDRGTSAGDILGIANDVGQASQSSYLGGLPLAQYGQMLGLKQTYLNASGDSNSTYFQRWQQIMQVAVSQGLDRSQVASSISNMVQQRADSGSANVSLPDAANLFNKFAQSGLAGGRDGSLAQSYSQSLTQSWAGAGFGGDTMHTLAAESLARSGGTPKTMAELGKRFGFDPSKLYGAGLTEAKQALSDLNRGDWIGFATAIQPLMSQSAQQSADQSLVSSFHLQPGTTAYDSALAALEGTSYSTEVGALGSGTLPNPVGLSGGRKMSDATTKAIADAAKKQGVDSYQLLALAGVETGYGTRIGTSSAGALGLMQVMPSTLLGLQKQGMFKGVTPDDLKNNQEINAEVGAAIWKQDLQLAGGDTRLAAEYYNAGPNLGRLSAKQLAAVQQYGAQVESNLLGLNGANGLTTLNNLTTRDQQLQLGTAHSSFDYANTIYGGQIGGLMETLSDGVSGFNTGVSDFVTGATTFSDVIKDFKSWIERQKKAASMPTSSAAAGTISKPGAMPRGKY